MVMAADTAGSMTADTVTPHDRRGGTIQDTGWAYHTRAIIMRARPIGPPTGRCRRTARCRSPHGPNGAARGRCRRRSAIPSPARHRAGSSGPPTYPRDTSPLPNRQGTSEAAGTRTTEVAGTRTAARITRDDRSVQRNPEQVAHEL